MIREHIRSVQCLVAHIYNPSTEEVEQEDHKFTASLDFIYSHACSLKKQTTKTNRPKENKMRVESAATYPTLLDVFKDQSWKVEWQE